MAWLYPTDPPAPPESVRIPGHAAPSADSAVIVVLDAQGAAAAEGDRVCRWIRDYEALAATPAGCRFSEAGYEEPALRVLALADGGWYRIDLGTRAVADTWIQSDNRFHSIVDLLASDSHLNYLDLTRFDRWIYEEPGGARIRFGISPRPGDDEQPYEAVGHAIVDGRIWLHVRVLDRVCEAAEPRELARGWVPAKTATGELQAWFWSRGC